MAESGDYVLAGHGPLRAGEVEKGGGEGREEREETALLYGHHVAQYVQENHAHF